MEGGGAGWRVLSANVSRVRQCEWDAVTPLFCSEVEYVVWKCSMSQPTTTVLASKMAEQHMYKYSYWPDCNTAGITPTHSH